MNRLIFIISAIAALSMSAQAKAPYSGGSGTAEDPYIIATASDLIELAGATDDYDANFVVTADIDLSTAGVFTTAVIARDTNNTTDGFQGIVFSGVFDGQGHKISNLTINTGGAGTYYLGLFGIVNEGEIKNIRIENVIIAGGVGSFYIGGLAGFYRSSTISNCSSTGTVAGGNGSSCIGGLVGYNQFGTISKCWSEATVTGTTNSQNLGGLVGFNSGTTTTPVIDCYATGNVSGYSRIGGLVGQSSQGNIRNCYSTGIATGTSALGGFVGESQYVISISNCYFLNTSGPDNGVGEPLTDEQMKQQASFVGWDFVGEKENGKEEIWSITENIDYPRLGWIYVTKCSVTAGRDNKDKISVSGQLDTGANYYLAGGSVIEMLIDSDYMQYSGIYYFPINQETFKKGKYSYSETEGVLKRKRSFKYDAKTRKFTFSSANFDLSGLGCPVTVEMRIGDYRQLDYVYEDIVNGKKPIPIILRMGVKNELRVDKIAVKQGKTSGSDQLTVKGGFAFADTSLNMADWNLTISLSGEPYTIEGIKLKANKDNTRFKCSNLGLTNGVASVNFDTKKCVFTVKIKNADIPDDISSPVELGIMIGTDYEESVVVELD